MFKNEQPEKKTSRNIRIKLAGIYMVHGYCECVMRLNSVWNENNLIGWWKWGDSNGSQKETVTLNTNEEKTMKATKPIESFSR